MKRKIQIISAPSILGLKPTGVEFLGESLLATGLDRQLGIKGPVVHVPTLNERYSLNRDKRTKCLNPFAIREFSLGLSDHIAQRVHSNKFLLVLGGDCSILLGIMHGLKRKGEYGLIFLDAHADFYEPEKSVTGEVADMDLGIVTGRGPGILTNMEGLRPYVKDEYVFHIGQRDARETKKYGSRDIRDSDITCMDLKSIEREGMPYALHKILDFVQGKKLDGFWIHFDTDVLSDKKNPAVDYRLPGGMRVKDTRRILAALMATNKIVGMSVTIYNPLLDPKGKAAERICNCLVKAFAQA